MKTYIITDSTSEITQKVAKEINVTVLPLSVHFKNDTYLDGIDLSSDEFFQKLELSETLPKTSLVSPDCFKKLFDKILENPENEIFATFISSKLSGTYNSARIIINEYESEKRERIHLSDSLTATGAVGLLVHIAADLRNKGFSAKEIKDNIDLLIPKTKLYVILTSLKYLKAGGRISPTAATVGGILKIYPIVTTNSIGEIEMKDKARGKSASIKHLLINIEKNPPNTDYPISIVHSSIPSLADEVIQKYNDTYPTENILTSSIGPVVGTHIGPGCVGIAYIEQ